MIFLFDLDGTLVESGKQIDNNTSVLLNNIKNKYNIKFGILGGGVYDKIKFQLNDNIKLFDYIFSECGSVIYKQNNTNDEFDLIKKNNLIEFMGNEELNKINNFVKDIIIKNEFIHNLNSEQYGKNYITIFDKLKFVDIRNGLIYISPVGLLSNDFFRSKFLEYENNYNFRNNLINIFNSIIDTQIYDVVLGGSIGISIYPKIWNKAQVVDYIKSENINNIYFFGDKTMPNGNDYPIYIHDDVNGFSVDNIYDTQKILSSFI